MTADPHTLAHPTEVSNALDGDLRARRTLGLPLSWTRDPASHWAIPMLRAVAPLWDAWTASGTEKPFADWCTELVARPADVTTGWSYAEIEAPR